VFTTSLAPTFAVFTASFASACAMFAATLASVFIMLAANTGPLAQGSEVGAGLPDELVEPVSVAVLVLILVLGGVRLCAGILSGLSNLTLCECRDAEAYDSQSYQGRDHSQSIHVDLHPFFGLATQSDTDPT
jgi:hypothetical protein